MPLVAASMLAAAIGVYYFPQQPWIGMICGALGFWALFSIIIGEGGVIFPAMFLIYYGITLAFFSPYREALLASSLAGMGVLFFITPKQIELVCGGFSLFGRMRPLSKSIVICNPMSYIFQRGKMLNIISILVCVASAIYILEMIAR